MAPFDELLEDVARRAAERAVRETLRVTPSRVGFSVTETASIFAVSVPTVHGMLAKGLLWTIDTGTTKVLIAAKSIEDRVETDRARAAGPVERLHAVERVS